MMLELRVVVTLEGGWTSKGLMGLLLGFWLRSRSFLISIGYMDIYSLCENPSSCTIMNFVEAVTTVISEREQFSSNITK